MKQITKHSAIFLPLMVVLGIAGWLLFGALSNRPAALDELLVQWGWLPLLCGYGVAVLIGTAAAMHIAGLDLSRAQRLLLISEVQAGNENAFRVLALEAACWLFLFALAAAFLWVVR